MRVRIVFNKTEPMRYTSHLDLHRTWERTFRRAGLPLTYSEGYHPQPRINLASALPLGITSEYEIGDVWFDHLLDIDFIRDSTVKVLPPGIELLSITQVNDKLPSLQSTLISSIYEVRFSNGIDDLDQRVETLRMSDEIIRLRRGKKYDLRPLIEDISIVQSGTNRKIILIQLAAREGATGRVDEVIDAMDIDITSVYIHRIKLLFDKN